MGLSDFFSDLYSSLTIQPAYAEEPNTAPSGETNDSSTTTGEYGGMQTVQQRGQAGTRGGVSTQGSPVAGTNEETPGEKEANKRDAKTGGESDEPGHKPGSGGEGSGQLGPVTPRKGGDDGSDEGGEEEEDKGEEEEGGDEGGDEEEEDEEEEEPEDIMPKLQEDCERTKECAPLKHHYDECAERVTQQHEEHGKAKEDCVEEFFHLAHCASQCAAPKLFRQLK